MGRKSREELEQIVARYEQDEKEKKDKIKEKNVRYNDTIDRVNVTFPKGVKEQIKAYAENHNISVNAFVSDTIMKIVSGTHELCPVIMNRPEPETAEQEASQIPRKASRNAK